MLAWDALGTGYCPWLTLGVIPKQLGDITTIKPSSDPHPWTHWEKEAEFRAEVVIAPMSVNHQ